MRHLTNLYIPHFTINILKQNLFSRFVTLFISRCCLSYSHKSLVAGLRIMEMGFEKCLANRKIDKLILSYVIHIGTQRVLMTASYSIMT